MVKVVAISQEVGCCRRPPPSGPNLGIPGRLTPAVDADILPDQAISGRSGQAQMMQGQSDQVTKLLLRWRTGDREALDSLLPLVYQELRRLARSYLRRERADHTLQSTALVHEAYVRLAGNAPEWQSRAHFYGVAAQVMRQILVDHARKREADKRGPAYKLTLDAAAALPGRVDVDMVALDDALKALAEMDEQQSRVVELRFFAGLSLEETSEVLGISVSTVQRDWQTAKVWLRRELDRSTPA